MNSLIIFFPAFITELVTFDNAVAAITCSPLNLTPTASTAPDNGATLTFEMLLLTPSIPVFALSNFNFSLSLSMLDIEVLILLSNDALSNFI